MLGRWRISAYTALNTFGAALIVSFNDDASCGIVCVLLAAYLRVDDQI